jgi:predicted MFS family arabinose efflux permease
MSRAEWGLLAVLAAVQFANVLDFVIVMPLEPFYETEMGLTPQQFGVMVSVYGFAAGFAGLAAARFLDRFDRRTALIALFAGFTLSTGLCAAAPNWPLLVLARGAAGACGGVMGSAVLTIIGDAFPYERRGRPTGAVMSAFSIASIVGVPAGLKVAEVLGCWAPFAAIAAFGVAVLPAAWYFLPSLRGHLAGGRRAAVSLWGVLTVPNHQRAFLLMVAMVLGMFTIAPFIAKYLLANAGRVKSDLAWVYGVGGLATFFTMNWVGRLADRFGKLIVFRVMALATLVPILLLTNLPRVSLPTAVAVTTLLMVTSSGRFVPAMALITATAAPRVRGGFMSVNGSVQQFAMGLAALVSGMLVGTADDGRLIGYGTVGLLAAAFTVVSVLVAGRLRVVPDQAATSAPLAQPAELPA